MARTLLRLRQLWEGTLDLVYPPVCLLCERWGHLPICEDCLAAFLPIPEPGCPVCGRPTTPPLPCATCADAEVAGGWGFDAARAAAIYYGPLREGIHKLKFRGEEALGALLGEYLANRCTVEELLTPEWRAEASAVIPVPLHPRRLRKRGYNQAALLAAPLAEALHLPLLTDCLSRATLTAPQVGLTGAARRQNLQAACFAVTRPEAIAGRTVLLVDDVFTTGSTVSACARALRDGGCRRVIALTLAAGA